MGADIIHPIGQAAIPVAMAVKRIFPPAGPSDIKFAVICFSAIDMVANFTARGYAVKRKRANPMGKHIFPVDINWHIGIARRVIFDWALFEHCPISGVNVAVIVHAQARALKCDIIEFRFHFI